MADTLITKDGKRHLICGDSHFEELIRDYLGDDAALWYRDRINDLIEFEDELQ